MVTHGNQTPNLEAFHSHPHGSTFLSEEEFVLREIHSSVDPTSPDRYSANRTNSHSSDHLIEFVDVAKSFDERVVIDQLSLTASRGEFLAIVGRSGCGKTTLLRLLAGLESPTSGSALFGGIPLQGLNSRARIMFQDARLLPWLDVLGNVQLGLHGEAKEHAADLLADVGLGDRARSRPATLSGGQRQRVSLARALAHSPELLLLDEPLASVDALTRLEMQALIERLWLKRKMTVVLVTHDVEESIALADRVVVLDGGHLRTAIEVPLDRPRSRSSSSFMRIVDAIRQEILGPTTSADERSSKRDIAPHEKS